MIFFIIFSIYYSLSLREVSEASVTSEWTGSKEKNGDHRKASVINPVLSWGLQTGPDITLPRCENMIKNFYFLRVNSWGLEDFTGETRLFTCVSYSHTRLFPRHFVPPGRHFLAPYGSLVIYSQSSLRSSACGAYGWSKWTVWMNDRQTQGGSDEWQQRTGWTDFQPAQGPYWQ